jgi:hypothetical protein
LQHRTRAVDRFDADIEAFFPEKAFADRDIDRERIDRRRARLDKGYILNLGARIAGAKCHCGDRGE